MSEQIALIAGAGPAGLTAACELQKLTDIHPLVVEKSADIGGISKTVNYKGNRIDIGGHRFFSKSDRVMEWWLDILPIDPEVGDASLEISYQGKRRQVQPDGAGEGGDSDLIFLVRNRLSRIYYLRRFFQYPISLNLQTIRNLGLLRMSRIGFSYLKAVAFPIREERTLEDFIINRFGRELYLTFFKDYTEKVWGVPCDQIGADWGAQRIKGLSIRKALVHALRSAFGSGRGDIGQKGVETSLIERFLYPKLGPGQLWEEVARRVQEGGGELRMQCAVTATRLEEGRITQVQIEDAGGEKSWIDVDYLVSTLPIRELIANMQGDVPEDIRALADGLQYRDFLTVGVLLKRIRAEENLKDNWIYVQERDVKVGRLQIFNNWSPFMVKDPTTLWIGMEYFCNQGDELWTLPEEQMKSLAVGELIKLGFALEADVLDSVVIHMEKAYPAYFGDAYEQFGRLQDFLDGISNLYPVGRNGMHRYNNQDHSMLSAMAAVEQIASGSGDKSAIWAINAEAEYHEEK